MSSTNRSIARESHISDYYVTPFKPIMDLINAMINHPSTFQLFKPMTDVFKEDLIFYDPCAGGDKKNAMSYPYVLHQFKAKRIITNDIRDDSRAANKGDYLKCYGANPQPDIIITNPPFNISEEIILKAQSEVKLGGFVIMLLRLNFFGSEKRKKFWHNNMPVVTFVHRNRISFTEKGQDSIEYMHCIWKRGVKENSTELIII